MSHLCSVGARSLLRQSSRSIHQSRLLLNALPGKNDPTANDKPAGRRSLNDQLFQGKEKSFNFEGDKMPKESQSEIERKYAFYERLKAILLGLGAVGGLMGGFYVWSKWNIIKFKIFNEHDLSKFDEIYEDILKKKQKRAEDEKLEVSTVTNPNDSFVPGLYVCGDNKGGTVSDSGRKQQLVLKRLAFFDGMLLRDVILNGPVGLAITEKGDVYEWGSGFNGKQGKPELVLKDENVVKVQVSKNMVYALNGRGEVLYFPASVADKRRFVGDKGRKYLGLKSYDKKYRKLTDFSVKDIACGIDHIVILSQDGQVFTSATGTVRDTNKSYGQYGIPTLTQFDEPPAPHEIHDVVLLNKYKTDERDGNPVIKKRKITKIAAGDYHTLALDDLGYVWSFGKNTHGELAKHVSYETEIVPVPKRIELIQNHFAKNEFPQCIDIAAGGQTSYATFVTSDMYKLFEKTIQEGNNVDLAKLSQDQRDSVSYFAWGHGLKGQLGTGRYVHSEAEPRKIKALEGFTEFNEKSNKLETTTVKDWSIGENHVVATLSNNDVLAWGDNEFGQLGNGKKVKSSKPLNIPKLLEPLKTDRAPLTPTQKLIDAANNRLQLKTSDTSTFKTPNGKKIKGTIEQVITATGNSTAIFYRRL
ncbi:Respiratory complex III assembly [Komagataella phaffii CBS 7435]|uniref:Uncharacterized protein n=2 Tax=Komagataella phaffii TaxID=460519 RepID=C4R308_KOMPG|nr:uncharacterized protein PAS_chr2-2_0051 [Komagataella phaffii GS115]AOA62452.1 GQ67_01300T0 [Komagataella phaffii]CAH2447559.1 Respiratory complex III assembly [Komagataella phaffii CBS 7435]AOA67601.1 GQ68_00090T0 [Komagataella phaffii GS115]CAY69882.1 Putative protein of unknown function [Komagataella phaffii GS115]CCA37750.1 Respiratory complex III assembly [Komagataella phaffii CBS 7435]